MNEDLETVNSYNEHVKDYIAKSDRSCTYKDEIEKVFRLIKKDNPVVLELGCAYGRDAAEILKYTRNYSGMDASERLINEAKKRVPSGNFVVSTFKDFEFPANLDAVFAFASLVHVDMELMRIIMGKIYGSLNKGGVLFMTLKYGKYGATVSEDNIGKRTFYFYTPELIESLAPKDFKVIGKEDYYFREKHWFRIYLQK